jgi:hypothetical protein
MTTEPEPGAPFGDEGAGPADEPSADEAQSESSEQTQSDETLSEDDASGAL